jgi:hypothetical protein
MPDIGKYLLIAAFNVVQQLSLSLTRGIPSRRYDAGIAALPTLFSM